METFSALLALCVGNSPVTGELPAQMPATRSFDVFFDLRLNKRLSKQSPGWWLETPYDSVWRHCNVSGCNTVISLQNPKLSRSRQQQTELIQWGIYRILIWGTTTAQQFVCWLLILLIDPWSQTRLIVLNVICPVFHQEKNDVDIKNVTQMTSSPFSKARKDLISLQVYEMWSVISCNILYLSLHC